MGKIGTGKWGRSYFPDKSAQRRESRTVPISLVHFYKMQGLGNDFIMVMEELPEPGKLAIEWCNRRTGIGADGLVMVLPPAQGGDVRMRIFNADGSEARMCGNASRCIGKLLYDKKLTSKTTLQLETLSGMKQLQLHVSEENLVTSVTVNMGKASLLKVLRPSGVRTTFVEEEIIAGEGKFTGTAIDVGNPHLVLFVNDLQQANVAKYGPILEHSPLFPEKVNVEFVQIQDERTVRVKVWERGAGMTSACGTGACAVVAAAAMARKAAPSDVSVVMDGGTLNVSYNAETSHVRMTGPAELVFEGNKSCFFHYFKKVTGQTPSEWCRENGVAE